MKVILYMAITANGMIAKTDGNSDWVSSEDTESFTKHSRNAGVVILGRKAYQLFDQNYPLPLKNGIHYVMTSKTNMSSDDPTVRFTNKSPEELVEPLIFGQGMSLFTPIDFEFKLELLEVKNLSPQTVQLHYKVKK